MNFPVVKGAAYALIQANDMLVHHGTTQTLERRKNTESDHLQNLPKNLRSFEQAVAYPPNQVFIGNLLPDELNTYPRPWYENRVLEASREGKFGEIMPEDEFLGLMKIVDVFNLVVLEENFQVEVKAKIADHPVLNKLKDLDKLDKQAGIAEEIQRLVDNHLAQPLYYNAKLVGCVKKAHEFDEALSDHVMFENLVSKASAVFVLQLLLMKTDLKAEEVDYIIECSEEACGDMNQRGGGNFAKAIGETCGCVNATGSDTRSFCAGPAHAMVQAAALAQTGIYKNIVVLAGGASAKLGMNSKEHVKKGMPALEDMLGAFAVHVTENDGINPVIRTDGVGRHKIGSGSSPQAVTTAIVADPLDRMGYKIPDVDRYSVEMQNPEITEPAGAGDVPLANYKMIAALGVKRGELERGDLAKVVADFGMPGFAPTQGHIPSGVPFIGHSREMILAGDITRTMIIGKGSLFLGRLTNLFDGVSFVMEKNSGTLDAGFNKEKGDQIRVGLTILGSEHGPEELVRGAELAQEQNPDIKVVVLGNGVQTQLETVVASDEKEAHALMDEMLSNHTLDAAVTMHYNFPIGVSTVGKVITPAKGKEMFIANTTGASATERVTAMLKNTIYGIAVAKASGKTNPSVGLLNVDGARQLERALLKLKEGGYPITFIESARADGGIVMRGNDLLMGVPDIMVQDSLTGNVLMKVFSSFSTGGNYEATGSGYGPGVGEGFNRIICIISRASGASVVSGAIRLAADCAKGDLTEKVRSELTAAKRAGWENLIQSLSQSTQTVKRENEVKVPPKKPVTDDIPGVEVMQLEDAVQVLWEADIYAESGMGCTGPIVLVAPEDKDKALEILKKNKYL